MGRATSSNCSRSTAIHRRHEPMELEAVGAPQALKVKGRPMETHPLLANNDPGELVHLEIPRNFADSERPRVLEPWCYLRSPLRWHLGWPKAPRVHPMQPPLLEAESPAGEKEGKMPQPDHSRGRATNGSWNCWMLEASCYLPGRLVKNRQTGLDVVFFVLGFIQTNQGGQGPPAISYSHVQS